MRTDRPIRMWPEIIILPCPPCSWGKCVFCGYSKDCFTNEQLSTEDFLEQFGSYQRKHGIPDHLEIYNSGSFLDDKQISPESRVAIFRELHKKGIERVAIESRPEYIKPETLAPLVAEFDADLTVCIGLEVAGDPILRKLKKGFSLDDVEKAHSVLKNMELSSRAYLLVGAPFIENPKTAILDSVKYCQKIGFDEVSLLGAYPMEGSEGYQLWKKREWSSIELREFDRIVSMAKVICPQIDHSSDGIQSFFLKDKQVDHDELGGKRYEEDRA